MSTTRVPSLSDWHQLVAKQVRVTDPDELLATTASGLTVANLYNSDQRAGEGRAVERLLAAVGLLPHATWPPGSTDLSQEVGPGTAGIWLDIFEARPTDLVELATTLGASTSSVDGGVLGIDGGVRVAVRVAAAVERGGRTGVSRLLLGVDPIGRSLQGRRSLESGAAADTLGGETAEAMAAVAQLDGSVSRPAHLVLDSSALHVGGATESDELGFLLALTAHYARTGRAADWSQTARRLAWRMSVDSDTFVSLAKVRAARRLWRLFWAQVDVVEPLLLHVQTSMRTASSLDPSVNLLRATSQSFAALVGGADLLTVHAFDALAERPTELGRRVARHAGVVLKRESHLDRVNDPAFGSYAVSALTRKIEEAAWERFRSIEAAGGVMQDLWSGGIHRRTAWAASQRRVRAMSRTDSFVGVSAFPSEVPSSGRKPPLPGLPRWPAIRPARDAAPFEEFRKRAQKAAPVLSIGLGRLPHYNARASFAAHVWRAAGFGIGATIGLTEAQLAAASPGSQSQSLKKLIGEVPPVVAVHASDVAYLTHLSKLSPWLRERGARFIVATAPPETGAKLGGLVDHVVHQGCNVEALHQAATAASIGHGRNR